jgi:hypothetical protein
MQSHWRTAHLRGNGQYGFTVVGESNHQAELEEMVGGRTEESAEFECVAALVPEPDNAFDSNAVMVFIGEQKIGYLPRKQAEQYNMARVRHGVDLVSCAALIVGGWDRGEDDYGHFGVKLDVSRPFRFENMREFQDDEPKPSHPNSPDIIGGMSTAGRAAQTHLITPPGRPWKYYIAPAIGIICLAAIACVAFILMEASSPPRPVEAATAASALDVAPIPIPEAARPSPTEKIPLPRPRPQRVQ